MKQVCENGFPKTGFLPDDSAQLVGSLLLSRVADNELCGHAMQRESAECGTRAGWDGQGNLPRGAILELELKGHIGFGWTQRRSHSSGRNGLSKKAESEHNVFRGWFRGRGCESMGSQLSDGLELNPCYMGMGANDGVLGFRRIF